jgi:hypothetical protein
MVVLEKKLYQIYKYNKQINIHFFEVDNAFAYILENLIFVFIFLKYEKELWHICVDRI